MRKFSSLVILFVAAYLALMGYYLLVNQQIPSYIVGLQMRRYIPCALTIALATGLWCGHFRPACLLSHALVSVFWVITYPLFYYLTCHGYGGPIDNHMDIAFGAYCYGLTVFLHFILRKLFPKRKTAVTAVITLVQFLFLVVPLFQWHYWFKHHSYVTEHSLLNDFSAVTPFLQKVIQQWGWDGIGLVLLSTVLIVTLLYRLNLPGRYSLPPMTITTRKRSLMVATLLFVVVCIYVSQCFFYTGLPDAYMRIMKYL